MLCRAFTTDGRYRFPGRFERQSVVLRTARFRGATTDAGDRFHPSCVYEFLRVIVAPSLSRAIRRNRPYTRLGVNCGRFNFILTKMATLAAIKRQIAKLEAEVVRKTKAEMAGAIAKAREIMTTYGLTVEHLASGMPTTGAKKVATKKSAAKKVKGKRAGAGTPKYRDPKSGATWTGFGRAPGWIASAKSRDAFLIDKPASEAVAPAAPAPAKAAATKKVAKRAAVKGPKAAKKLGAAASKKSAAVPAKAAADSPVVAAKKAPAKKAAGKKSASKKAAVKKAPTKAVAGKKAAVKAAPVAAGAAPDVAA